LNKKDKLKNELYDQGLAFERENNFQKALECYKKSFDIDKKYSNSVDALAVLNFQLGNLKEADKYIKSALELKPNDKQLLKIKKRIDEHIDKKLDKPKDTDYTFNQGGKFAIGNKGTKITIKDILDYGQIRKSVSSLGGGIGMVQLYSIFYRGLIVVVNMTEETIWVFKDPLTNKIWGRFGMQIVALRPDLF